MSQGFKLLHTCVDNIGALIIGIGFGLYCTILIIKNPQNPILIIKAPILGDDDVQPASILGSELVWLRTHTAPYNQESRLKTTQTRARHMLLECNFAPTEPTEPKCTAIQLLESSIAPTEPNTPYFRIIPAIIT